MHAKPMGYALGACLLAATMAAGYRSPSWFEAYATGATRANGIRPESGVYDLTEDPERGLQALVVTGPPTRPTGAFRARAGRLTIARSSGDLIEGYFDIDAVGYEAADPASEDRELRLHGAFTASPGSRQP